MSKEQITLTKDELKRVMVIEKLVGHEEAVFDGLH